MDAASRVIRVAAVVLAVSSGAVACSSSGDDGEAGLAGTWRTASVSLADAEAALTRAGLTEWVEDFRTRAPFEGETTLVLEIGEEWDLYGESADGTRSEIDYDAAYEVDGDEVIVMHAAGSNTFRWEVETDSLSLEHLSTTMPAYEGVPEEVFQHALYSTAGFTRDS